MLSVSRYNLAKTRLLYLLEELKANSVDTGTLCIPPGSSEKDINGIMRESLDAKTMPEDLSVSIAQSATGGIVFWGSNHWYLVMPPFPVEKASFFNACEIEPLHSLLHKELILGLIIVRLGEYGVGVFQGENLLSSKVGTGLVHSGHRQGGSSSHRFERHRDKQKETFFTRVCLHTREQLEPFAGQLDYVVYGGAPETIMDFRKQCHFLRDFDKKTLDRLLDIKKANYAGLLEGIQEAWSSRVIQWKMK